MSFPLQLNQADCLQCGACEAACSYNALRMTAYPEIDPDACQLCKSCVEACPVQALSIQEAEIEKKQTTTAQAKGIWVLAEQQDDHFTPVVFELVGTARELAEMQPQPVSAILLGASSEEKAKQLIAAGADKVYLVEAPHLHERIEDEHAAILASLAEHEHPAIILIGATHFGRAVSARVATLLNTGLTADCTELYIDPATGNLLQRRPAFGGNLLATIETPNHRPQMASVRPQVMKAAEKDPNRQGELIRYDLHKLPTADNRIRLIASHIRQTAGSITEASILVAGGRGMQNEKNIHLLYELADKLGGTVAASRAAVEAGWLPFERQVGQTGKTVSPTLYIACGISGQIQHTAALSSAQTIIAINNDPDAPIFQYADYGMIGDVTEILPQLIEQLA